MDTKESIAMRLDEQADFRRRKAEEFPNDERNPAAVGLIERLAADLRKLPGDDALLTSIARLETTDNLTGAGEKLQTYFNRIGFDHFPDNATELLNDYRSILEAEENAERFESPLH